MAKNNSVTISDAQSLNYVSRGNRPVTTERDYPTDVVERPAVCMGKVLASSVADGVKLGANTLLRGQFDEKFGQVDPASDIHSDKHLLADALMRRDISASKVNASGSDSLKFETDADPAE